MKNKLKIFYVASEVSPFTQTGSLGDVSGALPKYLKNFGHDIRLMMPNYKMVNERKYVLRDVIRLQGLEIKIGNVIHNANAKSAFIPDSKVQIYFLDNKHFFDRDGLYFDDQSGEEFEDNAERYIFFSIGCLETLKLLHWQPDIIHCNDWQTAIIPILLKSKYREDTFFNNTKTLLSVHNIKQQGNFAASVVKKAGFAESFYHSENQDDKLMHFNFLKVGLENADLINTVSELYMDEFQNNSQNSFGLNAILNRRKKDIFTIRNGIDDQIWNPETDNLIPCTYTRRDLLDKYKNKKELLNRFGLKYHENIPVLCTILSDNDIDFFVTTIDKLMQMELKLIIVAKNIQKYRKKLKATQKKYAQKIGLELSFDANALHLMVAGSDIYFMPACFELADLIQLYSLAYGTIPIVRYAGCIEETIENFNPDTNSGTGFIFSKNDSNDLFMVIKNALKIYQKKETWATLMQNAMKLNFSWKSSVQQYVKLYQRLMNIKHIKK